jgi:sugar phosphate permease
VHEPEKSASNDLSGSQRPTRVRWLIFGLSCAVSWLLYLHRYAWGVIKPALKAEYRGLSDVKLGYLDSLFSLTYAVGQVPGGMAGDLLGPRRVLSLVIVLWSAALAGLAGTISLTWLGTMRGLFGLAQAGAYPNLSKVTHSWFPPSIRTSVQGAIASLSGRAGGACASLIVATLLMGTLGLGWRAALVVIGAAGALLGVVFWLLFRNCPAEHPWANAAEQREVNAGDLRIGKSARPKLALGVANLLTLGAMLVYAFFSTFVDQFFVNWLPLFLREGKSLSQAEMGVFASLPLWGGALGGAAGGILNDFLIRRTGSRRWTRTGVALTGKALAAVLLAASVSLADGRAVAVALVLCKFFGDWSLSTQWGTITDIGGRAAGTVFGTVNMVGAVAGVLANPVIGQVKQDYGWGLLFYFLAALFATAALAWLFINADRRLVTEEEAPIP